MECPTLLIAFTRASQINCPVANGDSLSLSLPRTMKIVIRSFFDAVAKKKGSLSVIFIRKYHKAIYPSLSRARARRLK